MSLSLSLFFFFFSIFEIFCSNWTLTGNYMPAERKQKGGVALL